MVGKSVAAGALVAVSIAASGSAAQDRDPDFLFGLPGGSIGVRGGYDFAAAEGDVYDFIGDILTVEPSDFDALVFGAAISMTLHSRVDAVFDLEVTRAGVDSEYRDFVEENDAPILQTTELTTVPLTAALKLYVAPRGREISRFAFIPAKIRPYIGGGGGLVWYRLRQFGDFVDFQDLTIFTAELESSGWGLGAHVFGGAEIALTPRFFLSIEARYLWAEDDLQGDFVGFEPIDLSGLRTTGGISVSF